MSALLLENYASETGEHFRWLHTYRRLTSLFDL